MEIDGNFSQNLVLPPPYLTIILLCSREYAVYK